MRIQEASSFSDGQMKFLPSPIWILLAVLSTCVGCKAFSEAAFAVGRALDPSIVHCNTIPTCPLCGDGAIVNPHHVRGNIPSPGCTHCGHQPVYHQPVAATPAAPIGQIPPTQVSPAQIPVHYGDPMLSMGGTANAALVEEMGRRNQELIAARGKFMDMQQQIEAVRQDMLAWQHETREVQSRLRDAELRRSADIERVNDAIVSMVDELGKD